MIEFKQHSGYNMATGELQHHPMDRIYVDGVLVGYLPHGKSGSVCLIKSISEADRFELYQTVAKRIGPQVSIYGPPKPPPQGYFEEEQET